MSYSVSGTFKSPEDAKAEIDAARATQTIPDFVVTGAMAILGDYEEKGVKHLDYQLFGHCPSGDEIATPGSNGNFHFIATVLDADAAG